MTRRPAKSRLLFAGALARRTGASVHVVHVNERIVACNGVTLRTPQEATALVTDAVRRLAETGVTVSGSACVSTYRRVAERIVGQGRRRCPPTPSSGLHPKPALDAGLLRPGPGAHNPADVVARAHRPAPLKISALPVPVVLGWPCGPGRRHPAPQGRKTSREFRPEVGSSALPAPRRQTRSEGGRRQRRPHRALISGRKGQARPTSWRRTSSNPGPGFAQRRTPF